MTPDQHATTSVGSGVILGVLMHSWGAGVACCAIGIFIDVDHFIDFWINRGFRLNIKEFLDFCYYGKTDKFYDILHGYEYIPFYWWLSTLPGFHSIGWGLTVGYVVHLLCDQFFNTHLSRWTYFLTYRLVHGFRASQIVLRNPFR